MLQFNNKLRSFILHPSGIANILWLAHDQLILYMLKMKKRRDNCNVIISGANRSWWRSIKKEKLHQSR